MRRVMSVSACMIGLLLLALAGITPRPAPLAAVSTFERRCSSCHGKYGTLFEKGFEKKYKTRSELTEMAKSMPGAIGMERSSLEVMVAYMRAISRQEPFLVWTKQFRQTLEGEFAPDKARIQARAGRTELRVETPQANRWRLVLPDKVRLSDVEFTVRYSSSTIRLRLTESSYTHTR